MLSPSSGTTGAVQLEELISQFKGKHIEEAISGATISNRYGDCYLTTDERSDFRMADWANLAVLCRSTDMAIVDIETLGLSFDNPIVLLGLAKIEQNKACVFQFLVTDTSQELGALWAFLSYIESGSTLITYNGTQFDIPYIKQRLAYYGKKYLLGNASYDALSFTRRKLKGRLPNYSLATVEKYFGLQRGLDVPGYLVPYFYSAYIQTRNFGPLVAIIEHNKQDLINLGVILSKLCSLDT